ncbi:MAG: TVP38/TMEM64 family protein [Caldilineaceae bacterium]|nr:TVP38/TMEM64 family protein [Caldilineaceae bacterium]
MGEQVSGRRYFDFFWKQGAKFSAAIFWLALLGGYGWYMRATGLSVQESARQVRDFLGESGWGPLLYVTLYTLRPLIFFPATLMTAMSGYLYGPLLGSAYALIGGNLSGSLAYFVGRFFGGDLFAEEAADASSFMARHAANLRRNGFEAVLVMRLIYLPFDLVNYLCGFVRVPWLQYAAGTFLGVLPGAVTFVLIGSVFTSQSASQRWLLAGFSLGMLLLGLALSRWLKGRR